MSEEKDLKHAQEVYNSLCAMLDGRGWHYEKIKEELKVECSAQGEDLPIRLIMRVDSKRQLVSFLSPMPFTVPENRRAALAVAVSQANNGMVDGSFDYNLLNGTILFRITTSYRESLLGNDLFDYMLMCACYTIDRYNDKFLIVCKNNMPIEEILTYID